MNVKKIIVFKGGVISLLFLIISCSTIVEDNDGNIYKTTRIGEQVWMAENLNVSKFRNGDMIPEEKTHEEWIQAGREEKPAWCYYDNDPENGKKYGKLYNWHAVIDSRGLAPEGWHIPSDAEWAELIDVLGGEDTASHKMKSTEGWSGNGTGTNKSKFSGLPGGNRASNGNFDFIGLSGFWWCTTEEKITLNVWIRYLFYGNSKVYRYYGSKIKGLSVRCLRD